MSVRSRPEWRRVDGVLLLDKPAGITSNRALQTARRLYAAARAGHAGTLDPLATGLLPVLFGEATKFGGSLLDADKTYAADVALGITTDTGDGEGRVLERRAVAVGRDQVELVLARFRGEIEQVPPMHSALKRDGRALYEYARRGQTLDRDPRRIRIHELMLDAFAADRLAITVRCSKGTYIRVLAEDIGRALGCGAHLAGLRRVASGPFTVAEAIGLDALARLTPAERVGRLLPVDALVRALPVLALGADDARSFAQGRGAPSGDGRQGPVRVYGPGNAFLGVGDANSDGIVRPRRLMRTDEPTANSCEEC